MVVSWNGHVEAVRQLLDGGADVNAKDDVSTCEFTDVSVSLVCLSVSCVVGMYAINVNYNVYLSRCYHCHCIDTCYGWVG